MGRRRSRRVAIAEIVRRGSIARVMIGEGIAAETDGVTVMTERVTGPRSTREDQGRDPEIVSRTTSARTDTARAQGNTGEIDRVVKSVDVTKTATGDDGTTTATAITKERRVRGVTRDVIPTAVEADRGHHTSIQGHAERGDEQKRAIIQSTIEIAKKELRALVKQSSCCSTNT
jgi:hypothetical protein